MRIKILNLWKANDLMNKGAVLSLLCDLYLINEQNMMYLLQLNLKKLYFFLKSECDRLFRHIVDNIRLIKCKQATKNLWKKFELFLIKYLSDNLWSNNR